MANQNALGVLSELVTLPANTFTAFPSAVTPATKLVTVTMFSTVGGLLVAAVNNHKLGYVNVALALAVVELRFAVYEVPVTLAGRVNVVETLTVLVVAVLFLCIGSVNVNVPLAVALLVVPPTAVTLLA
jgi:hypothetical protein